MDKIEMIRRLQQPTGPVDVILDSDTFNEEDDQFAMVYLCCFPERIHVKAFCAAPFFNEKSSGPADGMEKSYEEMHRLVDLMGRDDLKKIIYRGSTAYLPDEKTPVLSDAAKKICEIASGYSKENPLYIVTIGAITNVASALLLKPEIAEKITIVWLGGHALHWPDTHEFNMFQDVAAARVVFNSEAALIQFPCMGVVSGFTVTAPECEAFFLGKGALPDYLGHAIYDRYQKGDRAPYWSKVIWDVTAVSWLTGKFMDYQIMTRPIPEYDHHYGYDCRRPDYAYVRQIYRDALMKDLVEKLQGECWKLDK